MSSEPVNIRVLDREYTIGVAPEERDSLMAAAKLLDGRMREVRGANRMAAVDRIAVLADKKVIAVGTIPELLALDHPWIQEYFNGPRGRNAAQSYEEGPVA